MLQLRPRIAIDIDHVPGLVVVPRDVLVHLGIQPHVVGLDFRHYGSALRTSAVVLASINARHRRTARSAPASNENSLTLLD